MTHTAAALHVELDKALDLLADAELRYAVLQAAGRRRHPDLPGSIADMRTMTDKQMRDAMTDWSLAHDRVRSYAAAATAKDLAEFLRPGPMEFATDDELRDDLEPLDLPITHGAHEGHTINGGGWAS